MNRRRSPVAALALVGALGLGRTTFAQPVTESARRTEAQAHMDRGYQLFNEQNDGAALAEFMAAYQLAPQPGVRYNIGVVHAAMGRPVDAVYWLEACLAEPASLTNAQRDRAAAKLKEQKQRVGALVVTANVKDALIEIDSLEVGRTPLPQPIRVTSGVHVVSVVATGYVPMRREVKVAGLTETPVAFDLIPTQASFARLMISTELPGAEVMLDGAVAGKTPLPGSLKLAPGAHRIELRRAGYISVQRDLTLGDGDAQAFKEEPKEDADWIAENGGWLALTFSETHAVVTVNGVPRGEYRGSLRLAPGIHHIRAERAGFATVERDVDVTAGGTTAISIRFQPTPDTLVKIAEDYNHQRNWGIAATVGGSVIASAGTATLVYSLIQYSQDCSDDSPDYLRLIWCPKDKVWTGIGGLSLGLGAAAMVAGIILIERNNDPHRYDMKPSGHKLTRLSVLPTAWPGADGVAIGVIGTF